MYTLSKRSEDNLKGVDKNLVAVIYELLKVSPYDFTIIEGLRTLERQKELLAQKKTRTLDSKHLTGKAVDFVVYDTSEQLTWEPLFYKAVADKAKEVANKLNIKITWGGDWPTFKDYDHLELI